MDCRRILTRLVPGGCGVNKLGAIRILIADDHAVVREGLTSLINRRADMQVVGEARDGIEAVEQYNSLHPDVALIDLRMPRMSGADAMKAIRERFPDARLIVLTTFDSNDDISLALLAGARGYLLKGSATEELLRCIRDVQSGQLCIPPEIVAKLSARLSNATWDPRDAEIIKLISEDKDDIEIAKILHVSDRTVATSVKRILDKLGIQERSMVKMMTSPPSSGTFR